MKFYIEIKERETRDRQEQAAMLTHRLRSIKYFQRLHAEKVIDYAFQSEDGATTYLRLRSESHEALDRLLKANPLFPYSNCTTLPSASMASMIREMQEYIGEKVLTESEIAEIDDHDNHHVTISPDKASYVQACKITPAFSSLLPLEDQIEIYRRTLVSQRGHTSAIELADDNPVGLPWGILLLDTDSIEEARAHVAKAPIYPDTEVTLLRLIPLPIAFKATTQKLTALGRQIPHDVLLEDFAVTSSSVSGKKEAVIKVGATAA